MRKLFIPLVITGLFLAGCSYDIPSVVYPGDEGYVEETLSGIIDDYLEELSEAVDDVVNLGTDDEDEYVENTSIAESDEETEPEITGEEDEGENSQETIAESEGESSASEISESYSDVLSLFSLDLVPEYDDSPYCIINDNVPYFTEYEIEEANTSYIYLSELDDLGRCGVTMASIATDIMPIGEERDDISSVTPTGWHQMYYEWIDNGGWLYNRCHLLGWQFTGLNADERNLITGTRYLNVEGMLPFENSIADYCYDTNNHVLYRVTPIFDGDNLVANGVLMEAISVEDGGEGVEFNIFCYNVQPGVWIDYATGENLADD